VIEIRLPRVADADPCAALAALVIGEERSGAFVRSHFERHHLIVAEADREVVGFLAYRTDWFQCTFVTLVVVKEGFRRKGIAREFFKAVEAMSPTPRLFSSSDETNPISIRMHMGLGFTPSGHIDNLPQGTRELLFYRRIPPRGAS
jgi:GNAT superfamily N-acetyltransferase